MLDVPNMILGNCVLVRHCVWSSGGALATLEGRRRRLLDLKARRSEVVRVTRGADSKSTSLFCPGDSGLLLFFALPRFEVEQAAPTATRGRESVA